MLTPKRKNNRRGQRSANRNGNYYNQKNHIKFSKSYKDPKREQNHKKLMDTLEEGSKQNHQFDVFANINEKYAHDLVIIGAIAQMAIGIAEKHRSDAEKKLLERIQKEEMADKDFKANMENYLDFKTNVKYSKIIEAKLNDTNINDKQKEYLNNELQKTLAKIESNAKAFNFHTDNPDETLKFSSSKEFIEFIDSQEENSFAKSYRADILDADELKNIYQSDTNKLFALAVETRDKFDSVSLNSLDKKSTQTINENETCVECVEIAEKVSPILQTVS